MFCDSSWAINWSEDPVQHLRTTHVELQYYYIRDLVATWLICTTGDAISGSFTKPTPAVTFNGHPASWGGNR
jgi:hypothetical protein